MAERQPVVFAEWEVSREFWRSCLNQYKDMYKSHINIPSVFIIILYIVALFFIIFESFFLRSISLLIVLIVTRFFMSRYGVKSKIPVKIKFSKDELVVDFDGFCFPQYIEIELKDSALNGYWLIYFKIRSTTAWFSIPYDRYFCLPVPAGKIDDVKITIASIRS